MSQSDKTQNALEGVVHLGISALFYLATTKFLDMNQNHVEKEERKKEEFRKLKEYDPEELKQQISEELKKTKQKGEVECGKFFVRGTISSENPLLAELSSGQNLKVVMAIQDTYDIMATVGEKKVLKNEKVFKRRDKLVAPQVQLLPLIQKGTWRDNTILQVENLDKASRGKVLKFVGSKETSLFPGGLDLAAIGIGSVIKIGFEKNEVAIRVGDKLTLYGKVLYDTVNKILKMEKPSHILTNKAEYEDYLSSFSLSSLGVGLFGLLFAVEVFMAGRSVSILLGLYEPDSKK